MYECPIQNTGDSGTINTKVENKNLVNIDEFTSTAVTSSTIQEFTNFKVGQTYIFSAKLDFGSSSKSGRIRFQINYNDGTSDSYIGTWVSGTGIQTSTATVTVTDNVEKILLQYQANNTGIRYYDFQLEVNSTATSYTPHAEQNFTLPCQQPMRSIGTTRDNFFKNVVGSEYYNSELVEGAWYERHTIGKLTLNGSESGTASWVIITGQNNIEKFYSGYVTGRLLPLNATQLCNYGTWVQATYNWGINNQFTYSSDGAFTIVKPTDMTLEQWKTKLAEENLICYFQQITPTYLLCTPAQVEVLEAISKAKSYYEQTNVYSTDEVSPVYDVEAYQDENLVINEINQAIVALGGV